MMAEETQAVQAAESSVVQETEDTKVETKTEKKEKKPSKFMSFFTEERVEIIVAILLGVTALLTAWASWIGSLHGGNQATNYTKSNNLASEGNAEYNAAAQMYLSDLLAWNTISDYFYDIEIAELHGEYEEADLIRIKKEEYEAENCSDILADGLEWYRETDDAFSPFEMEGIIDRYYETANELLEESQEALEEGQRDNTNGDAFNLVTVIYSLVLFLLGIVSIFKRLPNRVILVCAAAFGMLAATIYMCTIPMPTGFSLASFFGG